MIQTGSRLFDFSLQNQYGESVTSTGLSEGRVLVVFYPWAFSRVCGSELEALNESYEYFAKRNVRIVGISVDHKFTLRSYAESLGIKFELLADFWPHGEVANQMGAFDEQQGVATRVSLLLEDGVVRNLFRSGMGEARKIEDYKHAVDGL
ncbi:redoxin domain-containing protein [Glutamicibacter ectropisis]|uniref:Redoxin domain-containing protein n=1 Tax=Glutamicibacter ectropisis TaxID=3046593 RepID=A0AAU6WH82_9MICC